MGATASRTPGQCGHGTRADAAPGAGGLPIEEAFPSLDRWAAGNTGIPYAWTFASGRPGPRLLLQALTHGNEVCGAIALDWLLACGIRPTRGTLTFVFANVAAYRSFDPGDPFASRCVDEDLNRVWSADVLDGPRSSTELARARELRVLVDRTEHLLDLHSMTDRCVPLVLAGRRAKALAVARALGMPRDIIVDAGHQGGTRLRDYAFFDDDADARTALLIECGQHWEACAAGVARQSTLRFLSHFDVVDPGFVVAHLDTGALPEQRVIEVTSTVTITSERFEFAMPVNGLDVVPIAGTLLALDGDRRIETPYDDCVLVMPARRPQVGETAVRLGRVIG